MMEFLFEYGLFLLKVVTVAAAIGGLIVLVISASRTEHSQGDLKVEKLNDKYREMANTLRRTVLNKPQLKVHEKEEKKRIKREDKSSDTAEQPRTYVLNFKGDMRASAVESLREEVTAVVSVARPGDEVVVCLENAGGTVHEHGLGASQLQRIKEREIPLTVIVDKVAASGGYLMASIADRIVAAPFAIIGSIGVLAQLPNFNRFLEDRGIDFEQITAGKYKRTLTMFGKNTEEDRAKTREDLEEVHRLFKNAVSAHRPGLDIEAVATGEYWYGSRALELGLVDELGSSDDYLMRAADDRRIFSVKYKSHETVLQKLQSALGSAAESLGVISRSQL